jgi:hypothetical protein
MAVWLGVGCLFGTGPMLADTAFDAPGNFNPIVPGYFADPTLKKFGDLYYLYATTDGNGGGRGPATAWVSKDFVNWTLVAMNWPTSEVYWAPDVVKNSDGKYYLYYNQPCNTFAGVSDTPIGPWAPVTPGEGLVIRDRLVKDVITLDTQLFQDKDGTWYGYWGTWGIYPNSGCGVGVFNADMKSFARLGMIPNTQAKDFFEAPFMIERNGVYYFTYSSGSCHDATYRVQYAVGTKPDGEFKMGPNNPILATTRDNLVHGPGHHSILKEGEEYYIVYHRHDIPVTPNGMHRQTCVDRLVFEGDGVIKKVEPTHQGIGFLGSKHGLENLAFGKPVTASSFYRDTLRKHVYKPEYAVDDNNATLWRPADNRLGHWLLVDLGSTQRVRRTLTSFEYGTWYYQYFIEGSMDGQSWKVFADRRKNKRWGSPMVDNGDLEARYLRITVTGTEVPGLFCSLWSFKAYSEAPADPLLAMADRAFETFVAPKQKAFEEPVVTERKGSEDVGTQSGADLLIHLDAAAFQLGTPISAWTNTGKLRGEFRSAEVAPMVSMAGGRKAVRFSGKEILTASFTAPRSLAGNSSFTVATWVNNPEVAESECIVSWAGRGGPDGTTAQFGYGTHAEFGAVGHWGFADQGFRGGVPKAGQWHHLAVVFDGVVERVYVDGVLNSSEAKMLLMHEGRPVYVGASEPGSELFDGYLASLRVYDGALDEAAVKELAADAPSADVLLHLDSARLEYGKLTAWENNGSLGGMLVSSNSTPVVEDVRGRIAARFQQGQFMDFVPREAVPAPEFTLLMSVLSSDSAAGAVEIEGADGNRVGLPVQSTAGAWRDVAVVYRAGQGVYYTNGVASGQAPPLPERLKSLRLGGDPGFNGALARVQVFRRALSAEEVSQLHAVWKGEWKAPTPSPAVFEQKPVALSTTFVAMTAKRGESDAGGVEYRFTETSGGPVADSSGWIHTPSYLDHGLQPNTRYSYAVAMRDALGNVSVASAPVEVVTAPGLFENLVDRFDAAHDFLVQGTTGTMWDEVLGEADGSAPEAIVARDGVLRLQSKGTVWDGGKPLGAFLFKKVPGDFVVQVKVVDYAGLSTRRVPGNNDGGLMVRVPSVADAGRGEDFLQLNFFPIWNQGNMVTTVSGGRSQRGNMLAWDAHRHMQIIRQGTLFYFRTSADGEQWQDMPGSPVERDDMAGLPLQVGLYHASYGRDTSYVDFTDFQLTVRKPQPPQ